MHQIFFCFDAYCEPLYDGDWAPEGASGGRFEGKDDIFFILSAVRALRSKVPSVSFGRAVGYADHAVGVSAPLMPFLFFA